MSRLRSKIALGQVIKGQVTICNPHLGYFEVDRTYRIYINLFDQNLHLPDLNDTVEITDPQKFDLSTYTAVIGPDTVCKYSNSCSKPDVNNIANMLKDNLPKFLPDEIVALDKIIRKLESFLPAEFVLLCVSEMIKLMPRLDDAYSSIIVFERIQGKIPSDLFFANSNSEKYSFLKFQGLIIHNVYHNKRAEGPPSVRNMFQEVLFGILKVSPIHGNFTLKDNNSEIIIKFTNEADWDKTNFKDFHNTLVRIHCYTVFNEIYKDTAQATLHYVMVNPHHVSIISKDFEEKEDTFFYGINEVCEPNKKYSYYMKPIKISDVIWGYKNSPECWVQAAISPTSDFSYTEWAYMVFSKKQLSFVPFFKEEVIYKVHTDSKFKFENITTYKELFGLREYKKVLIVHEDSLFHETNLSSCPMNKTILKDCSEVQAHISRTTDYKTFSFELKVHKKMLKPEPFSSWFPRRHNQKYFGDLKKHQQQLVFINPETQSFIDLYLCNRENHFLPLGLVPDMIIRVNHLQVHKRKYLKPTVFTTFEMVRYDPPLWFSSANLFFTDIHSWQWSKTKPSLISLYRHHPKNSVIYSIFNFRAVLDICLKVLCQTCGKELTLWLGCNCLNKEKKLETSLVLQAEDPLDDFVLIDVEGLKFLSDFLNMPREINALIDECIKHDTNLSINMLKVPEGSEWENKDFKPALKEIVVYLRNVINYKKTPLISAVLLRQWEDNRKPWQLITYKL